MLLGTPEELNNFVNAPPSPSKLNCFRKSCTFGVFTINKSDAYLKLHSTK